MTFRQAQSRANTVQFNPSLKKYATSDRCMRDVLIVLFVNEGTTVTRNEVITELSDMYGSSSISNAWADLRRQGLRDFTINNTDMRFQYSTFR
jgi:hypothetical protein